MSHGLSARPELPADDVAAVVAALDALLSVRPSAAALDPVPTWRFSGRWFNQGRFSQRRPRRS